MEITIDDFHETNHKLDLLFALHDKRPEFKFNLFTIPGLCSIHFIEFIKRFDWIDMIPHGYLHPDPRECQYWNYEKSMDYLKNISELNLTKGFKAPGWQISDGMYKALLEEGYWVADQHYNDERKPKELRVHHLNNNCHFHIGHMGGYNPNEIELCINHILKLEGEFNLIKDIL